MPIPDAVRGVESSRLTLLRRIIQFLFQLLPHRRLRSESGVGAGGNGLEDGEYTDWDDALETPG